VDALTIVFVVEKCKINGSELTIDKPDKDVKELGYLACIKRLCNRDRGTQSQYVKEQCAWAAGRCAYALPNSAQKYSRGIWQYGQ
jgi:hypothetical protein